jgi:hypothetical protein
MRESAYSAQHQPDFQTDSKNRERDAPAGSGINNAKSIIPAHDRLSWW